MTCWVLSDQEGDVYAVASTMTEAVLAQAEVEARFWESRACGEVAADVVEGWLPLTIRAVSDDEAAEMRARVQPILEMAGAVL